MRPSPGRSGLALVAWLGLVVHLGASACGSLLCGLGQGSSCCAMAAPAHGDDAAEDPGHTVKRAPCGCCEDEAHACATSVAPVLEAELARVPGASLWALAPAPVATASLTADRGAEPPAWWARPPPTRPAATKTIVLLL